MAKITLKELAAKMEAKAAGLEQKASDIAVDAAIKVVTHLAFNTPADRSEALSNWQISLGTPVATNDRLDPYFVGTEGSTKQASAKETVNQAVDVLATKDPGEAIFISNVRPDYNYIIKLNDGSSDQHPGGFVETAALIGRKHVRGLAK